MSHSMSKLEGPGYLEYKSKLETYALAITSGDASNSTIRPYPENLRVCTGSYHEAGQNKLEVLGIDPELIADPEAYAHKYYKQDERDDDSAAPNEAEFLSRKDDLIPLARRTIKFPPTKVAFGPPTMNNDPSFGPNPAVHKHFLATASDTLRVYALEEGPNDEDLSQYVGKPVADRAVKLRRAVKFPTDPRALHGPPPMTSFDWCNIDTTRIVTCTTDSKCAIWDWPTKREVAHIVITKAREICDVAWQPGCTSTFVAGTGNGTMRMQDIRNMNSQPILYQPGSPDSTGSPTPDRKDLLDGMSSAAIAKVSFNPANPNMLACLQLNDTTVRILDIRNPQFFFAELTGHMETVNGFAWRTYNATTNPSAEKFGGPTLATVADDCQVLLWDASQMDAHPITSDPPKGKGKVWRGRPKAACEVPDPIENIAWGVDNDYLAITMGSHIRCMRI